MENNEALSELLKLNGDHYESFKKKLKGEYVDYDENNITDVFGQGLTKLKGILEGIIDNKK